jgi:hypothetical protein
MRATMNSGRRTRKRAMVGAAGGSPWAGPNAWNARSMKGAVAAAATSGATTTERERRELTRCGSWLPLRWRNLREQVHPGLPRLRHPPAKKSIHVQSSGRHGNDAGWFAFLSYLGTYNVSDRTG